MESHITFVNIANHANSNLKATRMNLPPPTNLEDAPNDVSINRMDAPHET